MVLLDSAGKYSRIGDAERVRRWITASVPGVVPAALERQAAALTRRSRPRRRPDPGGSRRAQPRWPSAAEICAAVRLQALEPGLFEPVGRRRDRQAGDQLALVVEDAGGHAAHAELELLVVARRAVLADAAPVRARARGSSVMLLRVWPASPVRVA